VLLAHRYLAGPPAFADVVEVRLDHVTENGLQRERHQQFVEHRMCAGAGGRCTCSTSHASPPPTSTRDGVLRLVDAETGEAVVKQTVLTSGP